MNKLISTLVLASILLAGCVTDQAHRVYVPENSYPAKNPAEIEILTKKPDRDFIVIADLQARGKALNEFRTIAARMGADAIIVSYLGGEVRSTEWAGKDEGKTYTRIAATAIKYKEK